MSTNSVVQAFPPITSPLIDVKTGIVTPVWSKWFNQTYIQTGSSSSTSLTSLIATVATINTQITTINATLTTYLNRINSLSVGRDL